MKSLLFLSAVAILSSNLFAASDCGVAVVNSDQARVREAPSMQGKVFKQATKGSEVCVFDLQNNYAKISKSGKEWINVDLLNFLAETKLAKN